MPQTAVENREPTTPDDGGSLISSHRVKLLAAFVAIAGALGFFAFQAFEDAAVYYYTVSEMKEVGPTPDNRLARVSGKLVPDTFHRAEGSTRAEFALADSEDAANRLAAAHEGVLPDLFFNEHSEIILEGRYGADGVFSSENVIVKCPSKYVAAEEGAEDAG